jgi:N-acetylmuramoyl-L-alanine amidase
MRKLRIFPMILILVLLTACLAAPPAETTLPETTCPPAETTLPVTVETTCPATVPEPTTEETTLPPVPVVELTEEEKRLLLKLGMAERGNSQCTECIALVMRSVLNRIEAGHFRTIRGAIFAQDQYTPVSDGSFEAAVPNQRCLDALDMIIYGWDESQGALFYEWCEGTSWHSKNLHLLFQHCDVRFYD